MTLRIAPLLLFLAACAHEKPFMGDTFSADTTLTRGDDRQLTYNTGTDRTPSWRPDGSGLLYMFEATGASPKDRCLGELPPTGGTIRNIICPDSPGSRDSLDTLYEPAPGPDGQLLYLREASQPNGITPLTSALVLAPDSNPLAAVTIQPYPHTAQNGKIHQGISNIRWLSASRAVFLAEKVQYLALCGSCPIDTVRTGIEAVLLDLSGPAPVTSIIPNTDEASSLATGTDGDQLFFTRNGDARVYRMVLSTGDISIIHDFGPGIIARDVQVVGNRMFAIILGRVSFVIDPVLGSVQRDEGGQLAMVDLASGNSSPLIVPGRFFRRPAASPAGDHLAAEAFPAVITSCGIICRDTTITKAADLWLFDIP
jgi:hypothetical protein